MSTGPCFIAWGIDAHSPEKAEALGDHLKRGLAQAGVMSDTISMMPANQVETRVEQHRLADYFERLEVLPSDREHSSAIRLFFERKPGAPPFWKDLMVRTLGTVRAYDPTASITLDYREEDQAQCETAARVPAWIQQLDERSREFWEISATYLLCHRDFTFPSLARFAKMPEASLRALHRNSYRAIRAEQAPDPLEVERDANSGRNVYSMAPAVRDEILCLTVKAEAARDA